MSNLLVLDPNKVEQIGYGFLLLHNEFEDGEVEMSKDTVEVNDYGHLCGITHCLAGWFIFLSDELNHNNHLSFGNGKRAMTEFLGFNFSDGHQLSKYMRDNPHIWGNKCGDFMFGSSNAFGTVSDKINLETIGLHWLKVAHNIRCHG